MQDLWLFLTTYPAVLAAIITFVLTVSWQLVTRILAPRPVVQWGVTSNTIFLVPWTPEATDENPLPQQQHNRFNARNIWMFNRGNATAEQVELTFNWKPQHMERFRMLPATEMVLGDNRYILSINQLNPKEGMNLSLLSYQSDLPDLIYVRCKGTSAKRIEFRFDRQYPRAMYWVGGALMLLGTFAVVYLGIITLQFIVEISALLPT